MKLVILIILLGEIERPWWHYATAIVLYWGEWRYESKWREETQDILRKVNHIFNRNK